MPAPRLRGGVCRDQRVARQWVLPIGVVVLLLTLPSFPTSPRPGELSPPLLSSPGIDSRLSGGSVLPGTAAGTAGVVSAGSLSYDRFTVKVGLFPTVATYNPQNGYVYVLNSGYTVGSSPNTVSVLDGASVVATVTVGAYPSSTTVDSSNGLVYVQNLHSNNVSVINGTRLVGTVPVGPTWDASGYGVYYGAVYPFWETSAYDPANGLVYVPNSGNDSVSVISGTQVVATVNVSANASVFEAPSFADYDPANGYVYVTDVASGWVTIINGTSVVGRVSAGVSPSGPVVGSNGYLYVPSYGDCTPYNQVATTCGWGNVIVINGTTVVANVSVGQQPWFALSDPGNGFVYVTHGTGGSDNVTVINGTTAIGYVGAGTYPTIPAYDSANGLVYVPNSMSGPASSAGNVTVLDGSSGVASVSVGLSPQSVTYDAGNGCLYVVDGTRVGNVTVLCPVGVYNLTFSQSGLPIGSVWSVTLGNTTMAGSGDLTFAAVHSGSHAYSIGQVSGFVSTPSTGVLVLGANGSRAITFSSTASTYSPYWTEVVPAYSGPVMEAYTAAYDQVEGYTLVFGADYATGALVTWAFSNGSWANLSPAHSPPGYASNQMTYDAADSEVLMFGVEHGTTLNQTWAFRAGDWAQVQARGAPPGRAGGSLAYDAADREVVLFGGWNTTTYGLPTNDTWVFSSGVWSKVSGLQSPSARVGFALAEDPSAGGVVLFGGVGVFSSTVEGPYYNDTWTFLHGGWVNRTSGAAMGPTPRRDAAFAANPSTSADILFGGYGNLGGNDYPLGSHETWEYANGTWTNLTTAASPHGRYGAILSYEPRGGVLLYGGCDTFCENNVFYETWILSEVPLRASVTASPRETYTGVVVDVHALISGGSYPYTFNWSFGDGTPLVSSVDASHRFSFAGNYTVNFHVSDGRATEWNASTVVQVQDLGPLSVALSAVPGDAAVGRPVTYSAIASGGAPPYQFGWSFGDGNTTEGASAVEIHAFLQPGSYRAMVVVNDSASGFVNATGRVNVTYLPLPFSVTIEADRTSGPAPLRVTLTAQIPNTTVPAGYVWSFGDGLPQLATPSVTHTFAADGDYSVQVSVRDVADDIVTASIAISVATSPVGNAPLWVQLILHASSNLPGSPVSFDAVATGGVAPYSYLWPGTPSTCVGGPWSSLNCSLPTFGTLVVSVVVTDWYGTTATGLSSVSVQPSTPATAPTNVTVNSTVAIPSLLWISLGAALALSAVALGVAVVVAFTGRRPKL